MLIQLLTRCAPTIVVWVGALMIMRGTMTLGTLVAFFTYLGFLYLPLERFAQFSVVVSSSLAAIERIFEFLDIKTGNHRPSVEPSVYGPPRRGAIRSREFQLPRANGAAVRGVLTDLNLNVPGGCQGGAGRPLRRRQNHSGEPDSALLRRQQRARTDRRQGRAALHAQVAARQCEPGGARCPAVQRQHPRQPALRAPGRLGGDALAGA